MGRTRTIGFGMDYSTTSKSALRWGVNNLAESGDRIILIHVQSSKSDHPEKKTGSALLPLENIKEMNVANSYGITPDSEVLDDLDAASKTKGVKVEFKIYWGDPRQKICDAVEDLKLDSIVVGSRGLGMLKRVLLGSVSDYVMTCANCPVTVVREKEMGRASTIGIGMDFSENSKSALLWAIDNLVCSGNHIILIHVQSPKSDHHQLWADTGSPLIPLQELKEMNVSKVYGINPDPKVFAEVLALLDTVSKTKKVKAETKIYWGDAKEKICDAVETLKLDSLVVGNRGLGPLKRVLLGSVSFHAVMNASCPVTVVKGSAVAKP